MPPGTHEEEKDGVQEQKQHGVGSSFGDSSPSSAARLGVQSRTPEAPLQPESAEQDVAPPPEDMQEGSPPADFLAPSTPGAEFTVNFHLEAGQHAGFVWDFAEGSTPRVCEVASKGPIPDYNRKVSLEKRIWWGDFVVRVNGFFTALRTQDELETLMREGGNLEMVLRRPFEYRVPYLDKRGGPLGMNVSWRPRGTCVVVKEVCTTGAVSAYNEGALPGVQIKVGDYVLSVNGVAGGAKEIAMALRDAPAVSFTAARPVHPSAPCDI